MMYYADAHTLESYRIEWRPFLTSGWQLMGSEDTHDAAVALMERVHERFQGQVRMISQHVTEARGLGE